MGDKSNILLCAGGTGGHLFPAQALAQELVARGFDIHLATDERAKRFTGNFPASQIHIIKSATFGGRNPIKIAKAAIDLISGYWQSRSLIKNLKPVCVIGFGGYPTLPPVMAASSYRTPILLHEQNAVMGRANRFLAKKAQLIVMGFAASEITSSDKMRILGNPVRSAVLEASAISYRSRKKTDIFRLLVFGGSQGAQYFSQVLPPAIKLLDQPLILRLQLVQQARDEDESQLTKALSALAVKFEVAQFFANMAERLGDADLIISRAGASTVSELAVIGRPSLLIPYPFALDHDQAMNAAEMERAGGCKVITQANLTAKRLAEELTNAINQPELLSQMASKAKQTGKRDATVNFADLVEQTISGNSVG